MVKKIIIYVLIIVGLCFGQSGSGLSNTSEIALGVIGGLNYVIYTDDDWPEKTTSAPRINIGINSRFELTSRLSNVCELSYLRLFYNTKADYGNGVSHTDHITFDNIYISSELKMAVLKKGEITSNIGIGLAGVWPFGGTWNRELLPYENANNCRSLFLSGTIGLELDKYPIYNSILNLAFRGHYCTVKTDRPYVPHPSTYTLGVAIAESIPLRFTLSLLFKL